MKFIRDIIGEKRQTLSEPGRPDLGLDEDIRAVEPDAPEAAPDALVDAPEEAPADALSREIAAFFDQAPEVEEPRMKRDDIREEERVACRPVTRSLSDPPDPPAPATAPALDPDPADHPYAVSTGLQGASKQPDPDLPLPAPVLGRACAENGRARTRLLGFPTASDAAPDPITGQERADTADQNAFPVGWLIVTAGPGRGTAFTLFAGVSTIGRGSDQVVRLDFGDNTISRDTHAAIAFDPAHKTFFIGHGGKANLVRRNARPVLSTEEIHAGDRITIGETMLRFVPLCGPDFTWQMPEARIDA